MSEWFSGAIAGAAVDLLLFPIDTIETRRQIVSTLQASLLKREHIYRGISAVALGGAPSGPISPSSLCFKALKDSRKHSFGSGALLWDV